MKEFARSTTDLVDVNAPPRLGSIPARLSWPTSVVVISGLCILLWAGIALGVASILG